MVETIGPCRVTAWQCQSLLVSCARRMKTACIAVSLLLCLRAAAQFPTQQEGPQDWEVQSEFAHYSPATGIGVLSNNVVIKYGNAVLTAEEATLDKSTFQAMADGRV